MGYTWYDAEREAGEERYISQILEDHHDTIVSEFVEGRMASYYEEHPDLSHAAANALEDARRLLEVSTAATLVFAMSSIEISIQDLLLKPVVSGLVHNSDLCVLLAELVDIRNKQTEKFLFAILKEVGLPSLFDQKLPSDRVVWNEKRELQDLRNQVVHRGSVVSKEQAERSLALGEHFLRVLYPSVRDYFTHRSTG